jgi:hypothetical protein
VAQPRWRAAWLAFLGALAATPSQGSGPLEHDARPAQVRVTAIAGVDDIAMANEHLALIHSQRGICRFQLQTDAQAEVILRLFYRAGQPFSTIEGITIVDNHAGRDVPIEDLIRDRYVLQQSNEIRIFPHGAALDWTVQVIDYYR